MKDPNERYWSFIVFTSWKTRQHLSATAFPPSSNIDFLRRLLSVCLRRCEKTNKLLCFSKGCLAPSFPSARQSSLGLKAGRGGGGGGILAGTECSSSVRRVSGGLSNACSLVSVLPGVVELRCVRGAFTQRLIEMYTLGREVEGSLKVMFDRLPLKPAAPKSQLLPG